MNILCIFGIHSWKDCKCERCGKNRDTEHRWRKCRCEVCGKIRVSDEHEWGGCKCDICGTTRDRDHNWGDTKCKICGTRLSAEEVAKRWADKLKNAKDYTDLVKYLCRGDEDHLRDEYDYDYRCTLWNKKRGYAKAILRKAGAEAINALLPALEKWRTYEVAEILIGIEDPKAIAVIKRLSDMNVWSEYGKPFVNFLNKYYGVDQQKEKSVRRDQIRTEYPFLMNLESASIPDLAEFLIKILDSASSGGSWVGPESKEAEICRIIGEELAKRGGGSTSIMRQVATKELGQFNNCRSLDMWWSGIGNWQG